MVVFWVRRNPKLSASIVSTIAAAGEVEGCDDGEQLLLSAFLCDYCINYVICVVVAGDALFRSQSNLQAISVATVHMSSYIRLANHSTLCAVLKVVGCPEHSSLATPFLPFWKLYTR